jgi:hypothetical protein
MNRPINSKKNPLAEEFNSTFLVTANGITPQQSPTEVLYILSIIAEEIQYIESIMDVDVLNPRHEDYPLNVLSNEVASYFVL